MNISPKQLTYNPESLKKLERVRKQIGGHMRETRSHTPYLKLGAFVVTWIIQKQIYKVTTRFGHSSQVTQFSCATANDVRKLVFKESK